MNIAIVFASSRARGNTYQCAQYLRAATGAKLFDLSNYSISFFDYEHLNIDDDFIKLMTELVKFDHIIFATPLYWYSMSAQMKVFIDRFSDLLMVDKNLGRKLKGKACSLISTGYDPQAPDCLWQPLKLTADFLRMTYQGMLYCSCTENFDLLDHQSAMDKFIETTLTE